MFTMNFKAAAGAAVLIVASCITPALSAQAPAAPPTPSANPPAPLSTAKQPPPATTQPSGATTSPGTQSGTQQPQPGSPDETASSQPPLRVGVNEVNLIFTVTDRHGHFVKDLRQDDFALLDDRKAPAKVSRFTQQTNLPLRVGIVIDASTSIKSRFAFEQQSSIGFLLQILRPRSDRAFVMGFDVTPDLKTDWTNNLDQLESGINSLRPGGGTALFDSVYTACKTKLLDTARGQEPVRKAMILISDGDDNQSRAYLDDAIKMCERAETIIYAISTNISPSRGKGDEVISKMASATGGRAFFPLRIEDMSASFADIQDELRSQYALAYTPADFKEDGAFRSIYLFANNRAYIVRAKKGYFAPR